MQEQLTLKQMQEFNDNFMITAETITTEFYQVNEKGVIDYYKSEYDGSPDIYTYKVTLKNKHTNEIIYQQKIMNDMFLNHLMFSWTNLYIKCESVEKFIETIKNKNKILASTIV